MATEILRKQYSPKDLETPNTLTVEALNYIRDKAYSEGRHKVAEYAANRALYLAGPENEERDCHENIVLGYN